MPENQDAQDYCKCHFKHKEQIQTQHEEDEKLWRVMDKKLDARWFILLITVLVVVIGGNFGIQLNVMNGINKIKTEVAVIKSELAHMEDTGVMTHQGGNDG